MTNTTLDISQCELELVRFMNAIQEFGSILVTDENNIIRCFSENFFSLSEIPEQNLLNEILKPELVQKDIFNITETKVGKLSIFQFEKKQLIIAASLIFIWISCKNLPH